MLDGLRVSVWPCFAEYLVFGKPVSDSPYGGEVARPRRIVFYFLPDFAHEHGDAARISRRGIAPQMSDDLLAGEHVSWIGCKQLQ